MIKLILSQEACDSCQQASAATGATGFTPGQSQVPDTKGGFTYDAGDGVLTQVQASGPMATTLRAATFAVFQKLPLIPQTGGPDAETTVPEELTEKLSQEAMNQDTHIALMASQLNSDPDFEVVLPGFDRSHVDQHSEDVAGTGIYDESRDPGPAENLKPSSSINMYATNVNDILQPRSHEIINDLSDDAETVAFVHLNGGPEADADNFLSQVDAIKGSDTLEDAVKASIERILDNPRVHVCVGFEQLKHFMKNRVIA